MEQCDYYKYTFPNFAQRTVHFFLILDLNLQRIQLERSAVARIPWQCTVLVATANSDARKPFLSGQLH